MYIISSQEDRIVIINWISLLFLPSKRIITYLDKRNRWNESKKYRRPNTFKNIISLYTHMYVYLFIQEG